MLLLVAKGDDAKLDDHHFGEGEVRMNLSNEAWPGQTGGIMDPTYGSTGPHMPNHSWLALPAIKEHNF